MRKKINLFIALSSLLFLSCGKNESGNNPSNNQEVSCKFEIEGGLKFTSKIPNSNTNLACIYSTFLNNNGSKKNTITGTVQRSGDNPLYLQDGIRFQIEFTTTKDLQVNQIIQIDSLNDFVVYLPYKSEGNYSITNSCNNLQLQQQTISTGFVKITQITNQYIYGEFQFNNLKNVGGINMSNGNPCPNYPTQLNYNIINGTFKAFK